MVLEGRANSVFTQLDDGQLPLTTADKTVMAEFIGFQMCRGMQYRDLGRLVFDQRVPALRERVRAVFREHAPDRLAEAETYDLSPLISQNQVVLGVIRTSQLMTNVLVNMRWQLVRWAKPVLLSSDHPAICWRRPHESSPWGISDAIEVRMPVSPTQALIASWHDGPDVGEVIRGDKVAAMSMNYHTERHAVDWRFWQPQTKPVRGHPLHDLALSGDPPPRSDRWQFVAQLADELIENGEERMKRGEHRVTVFMPEAWQQGVRPST